MRSVVILVVTIGLLAVCSAEDFLCKGLYEINKLEKCENPMQYKIDIDAKRRKINRTHDGVTVTASLPQGLTQDIGILLEVHSKCDGGYKFQQYYSEESLCGFFDKYAKDNFERALAGAGVNPPECPIPAGTLEIKDFVIDYTEMQEQGMRGDFKIYVFVVHGPIKLGCFLTHCSFKCKDD